MLPHACLYLTPREWKDIYSKGGNLMDVYTEPFFQDIAWQVHGTNVNLLMPCLMRPS